jgi:hypothetical protein
MIFGFTILGVIIMGMIAALWGIFTKAEVPGWGAVIPVLNVWAALQVAGKPGRWLVLYFIPIVNIVFWVRLCLALADRFSKATWFAIGMVILPFVFLPILALDGSEYTAPPAES